jgi:hypothetical protein
VKSNVRGRVAALKPKPTEDYFNIALDDAGRDENWYIGDGSITDHVDSLSEGTQVVLDFNNESVVGISKVNEDASGVSDSGGESSGEGQKGSPNLAVSKQERIKTQTAFKKAVDQVDRRSCETKEDYRKMVKELTVIHSKVLDEVMMD